MSEEVEEVGTIDDTIADEYKAILARESGEETAAPEEAVETLETSETETSETRARDENGRFAKKEAKPEEKPLEAETQSSETPAAPAETEQVTRVDGRPVDLARPPAEWKPAAKAAWKDIPEPIRAEVHRREVEAYRKFSELAPEAEFGRNIRALGDRYQQVIALDGGGDIGRAVGAFFQTASVLRFGSPQQKRQAIDSLEQVYGVPAREPQVDANGQPIAQAQPSSFMDPRVDQIMASMRAEQQARIDHANRESQAVTARFLSATNDKGEPLYPFVDNVLDDMTDRVRAIKARTPGISSEEALKQAYEAAVWANPETRAELVKAEQQKLEAQRREETLRRTAEAKRAASGAIRPRGAVTQQTAVGSIDQTISDTYREIMSRA